MGVGSTVVGVSASSAVSGGGGRGCGRLLRGGAAAAASAAASGHDRNVTARAEHLGNLALGRGAGRALGAGTPGRHGVVEVGVVTAHLRAR